MDLLVRKLALGGRQGLGLILEVYRPENCVGGVPIPSKKSSSLGGTIFVSFHRSDRLPAELIIALFHKGFPRSMQGKRQPIPSRSFPFIAGPRSEEAAKFRMASLLWMAGISLLVVPTATLIDVPISRWFSHQPLEREIEQILDLASFYAHGGGVFLILVGIILLAPARRWYVPRLATLAMGGGAVATLAKMFVLRPRPNRLNLDAASYDYAWIWSFDWTLDHVANFEASTRAFPSASLATATALTAGLWVVLPRGRWLFVALCIGTMMQRLACGAHFLGDLFGSASIGLGWAYVCFHPKLMGSLFEKMEPERSPRRRRLQRDHIKTSPTENAPNKDKDETEDDIEERSAA